MPQNQAPHNRRGGVPRFVSTEERDHAVRTFNAHPSLDAVKREMGWGPRLTKRVLIEEGAYDPARMIKGRNLAESIRLTQAIQRMWRDGVPLRTIEETHGVDHALIARLTKGLSRPKYRGTLRRIRPPSPTIASDPIALSWLAGVFDAVATISVEMHEGRSRPFVRITAEPRFCARIREVAGCGKIDGRIDKRRVIQRNTWILVQRADVMILLRRIEPYLRDQGPVVRRILNRFADLEEAVERKEGQLSLHSSSSSSSSD